MNIEEILKTQTALCIPTYNNRYKELLNYVNELTKITNVFIILSTDDPKIDEYKEYDWNDKVEILYSTAKTIGEKRWFLMRMMHELDYKYVIQMDDDIRTYASEINENTKRTTSESYAKIKISLEKLINKLIETAEKYDAIFTSPSFPFSLGFSHPGALAINKSLNFGQCTMINVQKMYDNNIVYDKRDNIHEDIDLVIQMLQHGLTCVTLKDMAFEVIGSSSMFENSTVCGTNKLDLARINLYLKYRDGISLRIGKRGELRLTCKLDKYWNTFEIPIKNDLYHNKMYELCQKYDIEGIKELIRNKNKK